MMEPMELLYLYLTIAALFSVYEIIKFRRRTHQYVDPALHKFHIEYIFGWIIMGLAWPVLLFNWILRINKKL